VSTAIQENFGIAVVESVLAGCWPLLPNRLSYPELLPDWARPLCLYSSEDELFERLHAMCCKSSRESDRLEHIRRLTAHFADRFGAARQVIRLDAALEDAVRGTRACI